MNSRQLIFTTLVQICFGHLNLEVVGIWKSSKAMGPNEIPKEVDEDRKKG